MSISSPRLRRLDGALAYLPDESEAMILSELDGYVAGLILCPETIPPDEWLPLVWSASGEEAPFADGREAAWYAELVLEHHHAIVRTLDKGPGRYAPFLEVDADRNEILWEIWIEGFEAAVALRPESWGQVIEAEDEDVSMAFASIGALIEISHDESDLEREAIDELTEQAPLLIPRLVDLLYAWRQAHRPASSAPAVAPPPAKIGRNDPCSCGSGKKFKKCCGA